MESKASWTPRSWRLSSKSGYAAARSRGVEPARPAVDEMAYAMVDARSVTDEADKVRVGWVPVRASEGIEAREGNAPDVTASEEGADTAAT